jgi:two-component system, sensor histidine kinase PdtaS
MVDSNRTIRRQLIAFSQFTTRSLGEGDVDALMTDACLRARSGIGVTHAKLLEYLPDRDRLLMRAGVGWQEGYVGQYEVPPDVETPIGHAFAFSEAVAITDYRSETTYSYPELLKVHGCIASVNVPLKTASGMFGVLEVDHTSARNFSADDIYFLTGLGNTMAQALQLKRAILRLEDAVEAKQLLLREMNHRIKNNLSLVGAMLSLQSRRLDNEAMREELAKAVNRINNLALVHDRLQLFTSAQTRVDAATHFRELCEMLRSLLPPGVELTTKCSGSLSGDCLEALTLMTNELVTNAAKHAFKGRGEGEIEILYRMEGAGWRLRVSDNGNGQIADETARAGSFGHQLLATLAARLNAEMTVTTDDGTKVEIFSGVSK